MTEVNSTIDTSTTNNAIEKKNSITGKVEELINEEDEITLEDLAPDGGWGWMIALAMILIMFTTTGPMSSFAIIFGDFLEDSGQAGMASSLFNSVFMVTYSIASLLTNTLLKRYSTRSVGIVGVLFFALPNIVIAFVRNIYEMAFICFIEGFGLGLIFTVTNTVFNSYFVKKRAKVMYASQVIIALGGIIYPTLSEKMLSIYGFRGTAAIIGALSLNGVVGMIMMHPVEWHAKKLEDVRAEKAREKEQNISQELALSNRRSTIDVVHLSFKTKWNSLCNLTEERGSEMPLLIETVKASAQRVASVSAIESRERAKSGSIWESSSRRTSTISASSLVNLATRTTCILSDIRQLHLEKKTSERQTDKENQGKEEKQNREINEKKEKQNEVQEEEEKQDKEIQEKEEKQDTEQKMLKYKTILRELVDMSLVKNVYFINLCFGVNFVCSSDIGFIYLLPIIITDAGHSRLRRKAYAALSVTISGIGELASKILLSVFTLMINIKSKYIFFVATILMGFARIGFLLYEHTLEGALITIALIGVVRSWLLVSQPLVIIEDLNIEKFASAYGINSVISSLITTIFGAIVGIIKDWTGSYKMYQISLLVTNSVFILPWILQFIFVDFRKWRKQCTQKANTMSHQWE
ncbi:LOW QUALITY PROTEIN: monocarboxylate transporter 9 [Mycetomoellerius zeteki]|uniref:LOW QUALITY PROTEIN: monocarboxylate transporter 9 n=1 Tax=Mycetomoellerius zeteki TaxID=64791 RepID=UPI00084EC29C|nr:PREDICTED: LOW QUALITY PROTEIN: monocarboxylate transporter 9-like [Trachymyrmex zeteki]